MRTSRRRDAFTLAETLVAAALATLAAGAAALALSAGFRAFSRARSDPADDTALASLALQEALGRDVASAAALGAVPFSGDDRSMSFARLAKPAGADGFAVEAVSWKNLPSGGLERAAGPVPEAGGGTASKETFPARGSVRFAYAAAEPGPDGTNGPPRIVWLDAWSPSRGLPAAVRASAAGMRPLEIAVACGGAAP